MGYGADRGKIVMKGKFEIVDDNDSPIEDCEYWNPGKNLEE